MKKILLAVLSLFFTPLFVMSMEKGTSTELDAHDVPALDDDHRLPPKKRKYMRVVKPEKPEIDLYCHEEPLSGAIDLRCTDEAEIDLRCTEERLDTTTPADQTPTVFLRHRPQSPSPCVMGLSTEPRLLQPIAEEAPDYNTAYAQSLAHNTETRVEEVQQHLNSIVKATPTEEIPHLALVLDIDDTCIYSPQSFKLLIQHPASPLFDITTLGKTYVPYAIKPVLDLFTWAQRTGLKIFFLTARPEKHPADPTFDVSDIHKESLFAAHYGIIDHKQTFLICMPHDVVLKLRQPESAGIEPDIIGTWKKEQHERIEKTYDCRIVAVLDDQPENIDRSKVGHVRIPSPHNPTLTPQRGFKRITIIGRTPNTRSLSGGLYSLSDDEESASHSNHA